LLAESESITYGELLEYETVTLLTVAAWIKLADASISTAAIPQYMRSLNRRLGMTLGDEGCAFRGCKYGKQHGKSHNSAQTVKANRKQYMRSLIPL
jgi:hypothetical protein